MVVPNLSDGPPDQISIKILYIIYSFHSFSVSDIT